MRDQDEQPFPRRTAIKLGAVGALAGVTGLTGCDSLLAPGNPLSDSYAARALGERYADRFPEPERLWRGQPPANPQDWPPRLESLIREDFVAGRVTEVDGWWLAHTEVALCVLLYVRDAHA